MSTTLAIFLAISSGLKSTTYGHEERNCGDVGKAVSCSHGATTASGIKFDPTLPQVAIAYPKNFRLRPTHIYVKTEASPCIKVHLVDKMHPRWIGSRGFDVTPKVLELLGEEVVSHWSGKLFVCIPEEVEV